MTQLTEARIRAAKPKGKPYKRRDSRGLYLLVTPPGGRLWRLRYRHAGAARAWLASALIPMLR